jgi:Family of unknown function (DUF5681)
LTQIARPANWACGTVGRDKETTSLATASLRCTRSSKGQSGNRKGRSKETQRLQSLEAILVKALNSTVVVNENQQSRQVTKYETVIMQIVNNAASGKLQFAKLLLDLVQLLAMTS